MCWLALLPDIHLVCISSDSNRSPHWLRPNQHWAYTQTGHHAHFRHTRPLHHFHLRPLVRLGGPKRLWWICQTQRERQRVCVYKYTCLPDKTLHPVAELCYLFSLVYFIAHCKASPPHLPCILEQRCVWRENNTHIHKPPKRRHTRLGTAKRMSSPCGFYLTLAMTFHPSSVSQAGRAQSVTDLLDSTDKDEDDIWTSRGRGGREKTNQRRRRTRRLKSIGCDSKGMMHSKSVRYGVLYVK